MPVVQVDLPGLSPSVRGKVTYAMYFANHRISDVHWEGDCLLVEHQSDGEAEFYIDSARRLAGRFTRAETSRTGQVLFSHRVDVPAPVMTYGLLKDRGCISEQGRGLFTFREPLSTLIRFFDHVFVTQLAVPLGARFEEYPVMISCEALSRLNHFASFPEHVHFVARLPEDLDVIEQFARDAKDLPGWEPTVARRTKEAVSAPEYVINPATCYHCYENLKGSTIQGSGVLVTALSNCHRYESGNHKEYGRLLDFRMREIVLLGTRDSVVELRRQLTGMLTGLVAKWGIDAWLEVATDPFFTNDTQLIARLQGVNDLKHELRMSVPHTGGSLAVASANYHGATYGHAFGIKTQDGVSAHSGCVAFGLERWALAFVSQFGLDEAGWPEAFRSQYRTWWNWMTGQTK